AGANSIVIGNYLTTTGRDAHADLMMLQELGFEIATSPEDK
ncbi:MAG: biotin synthase, partial [Sulfuricurvum sp.]|nr:biotin synthase [Sulfuricurvum sp.]